MRPPGANEGRARFKRGLNAHGFHRHVGATVFGQRQHGLYSVFPLAVDGMGCAQGLGQLQAVVVHVHHVMVAGV